MNNEGLRDVPLLPFLALKKGCSRCKHFDSIKDSNFGYCRQPARRELFGQLLGQEARVNQCYACAGFSERAPG